MDETKLLMILIVLAGLVPAATAGFWLLADLGRRGRLRRAYRADFTDWELECMDLEVDGDA